MNSAVSFACACLRASAARTFLSPSCVRPRISYSVHRYLSTTDPLVFKAQRETPESATPASKRASERDKHPDLNVKSKSKERPTSPYITLLDTNNEMSVVTLDAAQKLASHKSLRLVKETMASGDGKRDTYRLVHASDYFKKAQKDKLK